MVFKVTRSSDFHGVYVKIRIGNQNYTESRFVVQRLGTDDFFKLFLFDT
jgi:hypothetical protein